LHPFSYLHSSPHSHGFFKIAYQANKLKQPLFLISKMSTANDIYWPAGWSRERLVHASGQDLLALGDKEKDRMFDSLRSVLGTDGFQAVLAEMSRNHKARLAAEEAANPSGIPRLEDLPPEDQAPFLRLLRTHYPGEQPWGFVVFRTCCYDDDERWQLFKSHWDRVVASEFESMSYLASVSDAQRRYTIHWVEGKHLDGAGVQEVAKQYRSLLSEPGTIPEGLAHPLCLAVNKASLQSLFDSKIPTPSPLSAEKIIPFAVAIDREAGRDLQADQNDWEEHDFRTSFKVSVASMPTELFATIIGEIQTPRRMSVGLAEDKIWWAGTGKVGRFTIKT
jgi:hypothetical protein